MQFSETWLRSQVNPQLDSDALTHLLTMAGLEVEESAPAAPAFSGVVVARIIALEAHPDADKLKVCQVDDGSGEPLQIVCGAPNAAAGLVVPLARVGAVLPGDFKIKPARLRGVASAGMLCSAKELGIAAEDGGLLELATDAVPGTDMRQLLDLDDQVHLVKLTPNRADCLSIAGMAREVAALTGAPLSLPDTSAVAGQIADRREIVLDAPADCPRYCGRIVRGVDAAAPTPDWMRRRLERSGIRSISVLVDITNYVMLELGQPLHAFDDRRLEGAVHVRHARRGETLLLLNEQTVELPEGALVIADEARVLALAGIMGGEESGVTSASEDIFLESAFFVPEAVAGRARELGFTSDAAHRFERGVDFELPARAIERATRLILDLCGGQAGPVVEAVEPAHLPQRQSVLLRPARARRVLGIELDDAIMRATLARVYLDVVDEGENLRVTPPSFRFDIEVEVDLIEEIARVYGYEAIPAKVPTGPLSMLAETEETRPIWRVRRLLATRDFQEVINYAFVAAAWERDMCANEHPVKLVNPIASQMSVMRSSLIPGLVATLAANRKRQLHRVRIFETGRCFTATPEGGAVAGYAQPLRLAALAAGPTLPEQWGAPARNVDFFDIKGDLEALLSPRQTRFEPLADHPALHPGRAARVLLDGRDIGVIGELHPMWVERYETGGAPVLFELELDAVLAAAVPVHEHVSRFPIVARDLALVMPQGVAAMELVECMRGVAPDIVRAIEVFDVYHGDGIEAGKKSLAFRILMQDTRRTLEDSEVDTAVAALVAEAERSFDARLRG